MTTVGFIGLGNMGSVLAANLVAAGHEVLTHDIAGPARMPAGAAFADSIAELAGGVDVIVFSLPDGSVSRAVAGELVAAPNPRARLVIDTSTIGPDAARDVEKTLSDAGIDYIDAPVSGGVVGAKSGTLMVMYAGSDAAAKAALPVLEGLSSRRQRVGERPGVAQALKLANNFLAATALEATSEAVAFLESNGLDMSVALEVLNASSGQNSATTDKFPRQVATGAYAGGFANNLMAKDVRLYLSAVRSRDGAAMLGSVMSQLWDEFAADDPGADTTRIYPWVQLHSGSRATRP